MEINSLLYDNLGNFQWSSIAALVSLLVLFAQIIQFIYQQRVLKKNRKFEILIEFRMESLREVKKAVFKFVKMIEPGVEKIDTKILNEANNKITINLNDLNQQSLNLSEKIVNLIMLSQVLQNEESSEEVVNQINPIKWVKVVDELTSSYRLYETTEINSIAKYK